LKDSEDYVEAITPRPSKPARALAEKEATKAVDTLAAAIDLKRAAQLSIIAAFKQSNSDPRVASRMKLVESAENLSPRSHSNYSTTSVS
jgi:hypothetical protein